MQFSSILQTRINQYGKGITTQQINPCPANGISTNCGNLSPLACDTFQKSNSVSAASSVSKNSQIQSIEKLYNETYNIVVEQNPLFKELNIPKPDLICSSKDMGTLSGRYDFGSNSITLNKNVNEDWYMLVAKDKEGKDVPYTVQPESGLDDAISRLKNNPDCPPNILKVKLSDKEKELWQKAIMAHELRHCLQEHMIASLNGSLRTAKRNKAVKGLIDSQREIIKHSDELLGLYTENGTITNKQEYDKHLQKRNEELSRLQDLEKKYSYITNFKPHKILDDSATLKFSLDPSDTRVWSIKEHFDKPAKNYETDPCEIDAFNYEKEFIKSQYKGHKNEYSKNAILAMMMDTSSVADNVQFLSQNGYKAI